jgi:hypothetical protein
MSPEHRPAESKSAKMEQKKTSVFDFFFSLTTDAHAFRKMRKKALMLVFFGPFSRFFSFFEIRKIRKKSEKCPEKSHFSHFFLCSAVYFSLLSRYL